MQLPELSPSLPAARNVCPPPWLIVPAASCSYCSDPYPQLTTEKLAQIWPFMNNDLETDDLYLPEWYELCCYNNHFSSPDSLLHETKTRGYSSKDNDLINKEHLVVVETCNKGKGSPRRSGRKRRPTWKAKDIMAVLKETQRNSGSKEAMVFGDGLSLLLLP